MSGGTPLRVAIVGGGVSGLAAAYALARSPVPVHVSVMEADQSLGGKIQTDRIGRLIVERGPDALFLRDADTLDVLQLLGLRDEVVRSDPAQRATTILSRGRFHALPEGMETGVPRSIWPMARTRLLSPVGKLRAAAEVGVPRSRSTGDESVDAFVRRRFGAEVAQRVAAPLLGGIYSSDTRELSLMATLPHLRKWEQEHGSLLLASIRGRLPGAPRSPSAPSPFISLRHGLSTLVSALRDGCPRADFYLSTRVKRLSFDAESREFGLDCGDGRRLAADRVILATPAFSSADLVQPLSPAAAAGLRAIRYATATVVALVFGPEVAAAIPRGSGFLVAPDEPSPLKACSWSSRKWPHCAPDGEVLIRCHLRPDVGVSDDASLVRAVLGELGQWIGLRAEPLLTRVYRWPRAIPSYGVGHLERRRGIEAALVEFPGLVLAGAGLRGIGIPECLRQGMAAAEQAVSAARPAPRGVTVNHPVG